MPSGALCIIPVSEPISYRWEEPVDVIMVDLAPSLLNSAAAGLNLRTDFEIPERHGDIDPQVSYICQALWAESQAGYPLGRLFGDSLAIALTACLLQRYSTTPSASPPPGKLPPRAWKNVVSYVEEHLQDDISLEDMARIARLSPFHFSRCFKAMSGTSPHQYVIERRVERARELLTKSNLSLSQIAIESGFSDQSHLTRHMKRLLGLTPGLLTSGRSSSKNVQ
jgi:AraC family transcriptional regulator